MWVKEDLDEAVDWRAPWPVDLEAEWDWEGELLPPGVYCKGLGEKS